MANDGYVSAEAFLATAPLNPANALTCPLCGGPTEVKDSRAKVYAGFSTTSRRRLCMSCGHRYTTFEVLERELERLQGLITRVAKVKDALAELMLQVNRLEA